MALLKYTPQRAGPLARHFRHRACTRPCGGLYSRPGPGHRAGEEQREHGDPRNLLVVRKGSTAESSSPVARQQLKAIAYSTTSPDESAPLIRRMLTLVTLLRPRTPASPCPHER